MKNSKMLLLTAAVMACAINAKESHSPVDLGQYLTGNCVDKDGRNLLQMFAAECDNDDFAISIKLFELPEKIVQDNAVTFRRWQRYGILPKELVQVAFMNEMRELAKNLVNAKDNNGDTALNILNKKNSSHPRCQEIKKMCEDAAVLLNQRERIKKLADEFHKGADDCAQASVEELNARQYFVMRDNADLTLTEWYVAMTSQRDGQDALSKARAYECGVCPIYAERLENCIDNLEFIQKELGAGSLTLQEFQSNEELANKLRDFENQRKSKKETLELIKEQQ